MTNDDAVLSGRCSREGPTHGLLAVPTEELGCVHPLASGVGERLAVLPGDEFGKVVGVVDDCLPAGRAEPPLAGGVDNRYTFSGLPVTPCAADEQLVHEFSSPTWDSRVCRTRC